MMGENEIRTSPIRGLKITAMDDSGTLELPTLLCCNELPVDHSDIFDPSQPWNWPHLDEIRHLLPTVDETIEIGLILGQDVARALEPMDFVNGQDNDPYAVKTRFGWTVCGVTRDRGVHKSRTMNFMKITDRTRIVLSGKKRPEHEAMLVRKLEDIYKTDFIEPSKNHSSTKSQEDFTFTSRMESESKFEDGHHVLPLPLRKNKAEMEMPDNKYEAIRRAKALKAKLLKKENAQLKSKYVDFMRNLTEKGYARRVPKHQLKTAPEQKFYLVYHDVKHPRKPDKFRIVFNCSKETEGKSLNSELMSGPASELTNSIAGVLIKFRQHGEVAFMADIKDMFMQVRVPEEDMSYLRFLWWEDENLDGEPTEFQMCVHLFGATSSPSCANFALRKTALDNRENFSEEAVATIFENFYVDDVLKSVDSKEEGVKLVKELYELCKRGGFNLTKFVCTDPEVLRLLPDENRASLIQNLDFDNQSPEKALGVIWNVQNDALGFKIQVRDSPPTRAGLLSSIASIWDVLGLVSPFILPGRKLLQRLTKSEFGWHEKLPDRILNQWTDWMNSLFKLEKISLNRSYKPAGFGVVQKAEVHCFSDSSDIGYGVAIYVRLENVEGEVAVSLAMGKSRVVPLEGETIPRSELVAATVSAELGTMVKNLLEYKDVKTYFWTDSMVVVSYLKNETKKFKLFVANRIKKIKDFSAGSQWLHVVSAENPADDASRGLDANKAAAHQRWFQGAEFLRSRDGDWGRRFETTVPLVADDDPELKRDQKICLTTRTVQSEPSPTRTLLNSFSEWTRMKAFVANLQAGLRNFQVKDYLPDLNVQKLDGAEMTIIKYVQYEHFMNEIDCLRANRTIRRDSKIGILDPFLDRDGILRVGGRLGNSDLPMKLKHPIILPKFDNVTDCIVRFCHENTAHSGRYGTLNELRSRGYWVLQANSKVRYLLLRCVHCRFRRGSFGEQKMASLPKERVEEAPPFTYVGTDCFGPWLVKDGRKERKVFGVMFTCLTTRSVHIETVHNLDTDCFMQALRNFVNRRGPIRLLRSDNGSNFKGTESELRKCFKEMNFDTIKSKLLLEYNCDFEIGFDWKFNVATASHHGGCWERMIRSTRNILNNLLLKHPGQLTSESLRSLLIEVEGILNCRPLLSDFGEVESPLTPMMLLTQKSKVLMPPPGEFDEDFNLYSRRKWRRVQHLAQEFWTKFKTNYLSQLQERKKWAKTRRNFKVDDVVILRDDDLFRNQWPMGRIVEVFEDSKGLVRSVKVRVARTDLKAAKKYLERPISKIVLLVGVDEFDQ